MIDIVFENYSRAECSGVRRSGVIMMDRDDISHVEFLGVFNSGNTKYMQLIHRSTLWSFYYDTGIPAQCEEYIRHRQMFLPNEVIK